MLDICQATGRVWDLVILMAQVMWVVMWKLAVAITSCWQETALEQQTKCTKNK